MNSDVSIRKKTGYHHGDLRAQLVEATRQLVELKGPDGFSVSEACRVAGVSTAAPYRHFKDKEEMLFAVMMEGMERKFARMAEEVERFPKGSLDRVTALGRVYIAFAQDEPGVFRLIFGSGHDGDDTEAGTEGTPQAVLHAQGPQHYGFVQREVAEALGKSEIDDEARTKAFQLWTFVHGLSFLLIDRKTKVADIGVDTEWLLADISKRVIVD